MCLRGDIRHGGERGGGRSPGKNDPAAHSGRKHAHTSLYEMG